MKNEEVTARHLWTNGGGEVLVVRFCASDGSSSTMRKIGDESKETNVPFKHPLKVGERATAEDWSAEPVCGGGIHGWPWGFYVGEGKEPEWSATWLVYGVLPEDIVAIEGKVKFRTGIVRYVGDWHGAMMFVLTGQMAYVHHAAGAVLRTRATGAVLRTLAAGAVLRTRATGAVLRTRAAGAALRTRAAGAALRTLATGAARPHLPKGRRRSALVCTDVQRLPSGGLFRLHGGTRRNCALKCAQLW